jgi:transcriptional regulator with XRE-family HTH domain
MEKILERLDINNLIQSANDGVYCGTECKKKQKETELREKVNKAALNVKNAPEDYEKAQAEYFKFLHGTAKYEEYKNENDKKMFLRGIQTQLKEINRNSGVLKEIEKNNGVLKNTLSILENNITNENEKIKTLENTLDTLKIKIDTTKQKTKYEGENTKLVERIYRFNNYMFYILFVLSLFIYYFKFGWPTVKMSVVFFTLFIYNSLVNYYTI